MPAPEMWRQVDDYIEALCLPPEKDFVAALEQCLKDSSAAQLPEINVSQNEGKLLFMLARLCGAKRVLEIGGLGGYSALWLAKALPADGKLLSLELELKHAEVARKNLARGGFGKIAEVRVGPAQESLKALIAGGEAPFDLVFIDADKTAYSEYLDFAMQLTKSGSVILADNVIRDGKILYADAREPNVVAIQQFNKKLAADTRLETLLLPLLRESMDGLAIARRK